MVLLIALLVLLVGLFVAFSLNLYHIIFKGYAPFISTKKDVVDRIVKELDLPPHFKGVVYELGCGLAGFLKAMEKKCPHAKYVGFENSLLPFMGAKMQTWWGGSDIKVRFKDIMRLDLREADVIYCYLNPEMNRALEKKLQFECRPGALLVSYNYPFKGLNCAKAIDLNMEDKMSVKKMRLNEQRDKRKRMAEPVDEKAKPKKEDKPREWEESRLYFYDL